MNELYSIISTEKTPKLFHQCPYCKKEVNFLPINELKDICCDYSEYSDDSHNAVYMGFRECSNPNCEEVFVVRLRFVANPRNFDRTTGEIDYDEDIVEIETLPKAENSSSFEYIPSNIENSYNEANKCFYNECYIASAIMIRKTLEELCEDQQISGNNLKEKLKNLCKTETLPVRINSDIDILRKLGNAGAHINLKDFNKIGEREVKIALKIITNILMMLYESNQNYINSINELKSLKKI